VGVPDSLDSDVDPTTWFSQDVTIDVTYPKGDIRRDNPTIDGGVDPYGSIADNVWKDTNANGIQDPSETTGVPNTKVLLYNATTNLVIDSTFTDANGIYSFDSLLTGMYKIYIKNPAGMAYTIKGAGNDILKDSDVNPDGFSDAFQIDMDLDFASLLRNNYGVDAGFIITSSYDVSATDATCNGNVSNNNGTITIYNLLNANKVGYSVGSTYTGPNFAAATNVSSLTNGVVVNNLANATLTYTVRVFYDAACYVDKTVTITQKNCNPNCPVKICAPVKVTKVK
jgi:hypothetical protein